MGYSIALAIIICLFPAVALFCAKRIKAINIIGPVFLSYGAGIALANLPFFHVDSALADGFNGGTVLLAIPLLLFSTDFLKWLKMARATVISFAVAVCCSLIMAALASFVFAGKLQLESSENVAGMLVGVYTGGTINMSAIGKALGVDEATFAMVNGADVVLGGLYFVFLLTFAKRLLSKFMRPFDFAAMQEDAESPEKGGKANLETESKTITARSLLLDNWPAYLAAIAIVALTIFAATNIYDTLSQGQAFIILAITTLSLGMSFIRKMRKMAGAAVVGNYLLLMFCVSIGTLASIGRIASSGPMIFAFLTIAMFGAIVLHFAIAYFLKIDVDTVIITSCAAIFGPPFVVPVAGAIKNRHVLVSGLTTGVVGIAVGTYLGIGLAWLLKSI